MRWFILQIMNETFRAINTWYDTEIFETSAGLLSSKWQRICGVAGFCWKSHINIFIFIVNFDKLAILILQGGIVRW